MRRQGNRRGKSTRRSGSHILEWKSGGSLVVFLLLIAPSLRAQTTSTIEGTVTDQQGLGVAAAEVHISSAALAIDRRVLADSAGSYRIAGLPVGLYTVTTSKAGFSTEASRGLELTVNQTVTFNIVLKVGSQIDKIEVTAAVPLLESTFSSSGSTITPEQIEQMPINGRNYLDLLQLVPGVTVNRQADQGSDAATPILGAARATRHFLSTGCQTRMHSMAGRRRNSTRIRSWNFKW